MTTTLQHVLGKLAAEIREGMATGVSGPAFAALEIVAVAIEKIVALAPVAAVPPELPPIAPVTAPGTDFSMLRNHLKVAKQIAPGEWQTDTHGDVRNNAPGTPEHNRRPLATNAGLAFVCEAANAVAPLLAAYDLAVRDRDTYANELDDFECAVRDHLPEYDIDGEGGEANLLERIEYAGAELDDLVKECDRLKARLAAFRAKMTDVIAMLRDVESCTDNPPGTCNTLGRWAAELDDFCKETP